MYKTKFLLKIKDGWSFEATNLLDVFNFLKDNDGFMYLKSHTVEEIDKKNKLVDSINAKMLLRILTVKEENKETLPISLKEISYVS